MTFSCPVLLPRAQGRASLRVLDRLSRDGINWCLDLVENACTDVLNSRIGQNMNSDASTGPVNWNLSHKGNNTLKQSKPHAHYYTAILTLHVALDLACCRELNLT